MIGNSVCPRVKRGKTGKYFANSLYEREAKTELQILRKMSDRELLLSFRHVGLAFRGMRQPQIGPLRDRASLLTAYCLLLNWFVSQNPPIANASSGPYNEETIHRMELCALFPNVLQLSQFFCKPQSA
jgi:hypothetical protein